MINHVRWRGFRLLRHLVIIRLHGSRAIRFQAHKDSQAQGCLPDFQDGTVVHGMLRAASTIRHQFPVHFRCASTIREHHQAHTVLEGYIAMLRRNAVHRHNQVTSADKAHDALPGHGNGFAFRQFLTAFQHHHFPNGACIRQLTEPPMLLPPVLSQPKKGTQDNHHAQQHKPIPCAQGKDFIICFGHFLFLSNIMPACCEALPAAALSSEASAPGHAGWK